MKRRFHVGVTQHLSNSQLFSLLLLEPYSRVYCLYRSVPMVVMIRRVNVIFLEDVGFRLPSSVQNNFVIYQVLFDTRFCFQNVNDLSEV